jgi:hypothetical protein
MKDATCCLERVNRAAEVREKWVRGVRNGYNKSTKEAVHILIWRVGMETGGLARANGRRGWGWGEGGEFASVSSIFGVAACFPSASRGWEEFKAFGTGKYDGDKAQPTRSLLRHCAFVFRHPERNCSPAPDTVDGGQVTVRWLGEPATVTSAPTAPNQADPAVLSL